MTFFYIVKSQFPIICLLCLNTFYSCNLFLWWQSWIFSSNYSSLQCHM